MIDLDEAERIGHEANWWLPWRTVPVPPKDVYLRDGEDDEIWDKDGLCPIKTGEWICYARNHWDELLNEIRELRQENERLRARVNEYVGPE